MNLYREESNDPKWNAQRNLSGRTHYVDDNTLRGFKSRILKTYISDQGLLLTIVESLPCPHIGNKRIYRHVIFDVFGNVLDRPKWEDSSRSSEKAVKRMWQVLNTINAKQVTLTAIEKAEKYHREEMQVLREKLVKDGDNNHEAI